jgi:hypothetical protein
VYEFEFLLPERNVGLVIFHLFQKLKNKDISATFTEDEIVKSIREVRKDIKTEQKEQFNQTIKSLQKYYLWRDEEKRVYRFRPYAIKLCEAINEILFENFNPTEIQKDFKLLLNELKEKQFEQWYEYFFSKYSDKVGTQISALDRQIFMEVSEFRQKISDDETYDIVVLKNIVEKLEEIRKKTDELNVAFDSSYEINRFLMDFLSEPKNATYTEKVNRVINFFKDVRENLKIISKKIDSLKPKLNEYIRDINRKDFYKKFKAFIKFTLDTSIIEKGEIALPQEISRCAIGMSSKPRFIIIKESLDIENIHSPRNMRLQAPQYNKEKAIEKLHNENERLLLNKRVKGYLRELESKLEKTKEVDFSIYFFDILNREKGNINVVVKLAYLVMNKYNRHQEFGISITGEKISNHKYPSISVWQTIIYKKI